MLVGRVLALRPCDAEVLCINKELMVSGTAQRSCRVAAGLSLVLLFVVFFIAVAAQVGRIPEALLPVVKLLLLAGVLGSATTMVAMEYFSFSFDDSSARKKVFWFCVILFPATRTRSLLFHCLLAL